MVKKKSEFKGTDAFKEAIIAHLKDTARKDKLFLAALKKPAKNIDNCCTFIFNHVQKTRKIGYTNEEVFQLARHYYDEDNIEVGKPITSGEVIVNQQVALTEKEIAKAKQEAREKVISEEMAKMRKKPTKKPVSASDVKKEQNVEESKISDQASLF